MRIIENSVEEIKEDLPGKKIEYCGRICYNSVSSIKEDSYVKFISNISKAGHCSVLEHSRIIFKVLPHYKVEEWIGNKKHFCIHTYEGDTYISGNLRAWIENTTVESFFYPELKKLYPFLFTEECNNVLPFIKNIDVSEVPEQIRKYHDTRTFKIVATRGCTHQLVRHRVFSFSQQSQRYCCYSAEKFNHSIDFILPVIDDVKKFSEEEKTKIFEKLKENFKNTENEYFDLVDNCGLRAEDARSVLPNATASVIVMTGTVDEWEGFFKLRCDAHAQREIRDIAFKIKELIR